MNAGLPDGQPLVSAGQLKRDGRKVRSPQDNMPANGRGDSLKADFTESATENNTAKAGNCQVRVKRCGKSAPRPQ